MKHLFSLPAGRHYLNCAYMSPLSKRVEEAGLAGLRRKRDPSTIDARDFFVHVDRVRERFARLVNAPDPGRVAIVAAASYGLAAAARNTRVEPGQNLVIAADQFPSNVHIWARRAEEASAELRVVDAPGPPPRGGAWSELIAAAIDSATAAVAIAPVHWTDGTRFDLEAIGARAREVGAAFVVDGTQAVGAMPFDVRSLRPDALVCAAYKWLLGPYGIGVAYYGERYDGGVPLEETWMGRAGSEDFQRLVEYNPEYRPGAARYDVGESSNFILVPMLDAALAQILDWGVPTIARYCRELLEPVEGEALERGWAVEPADHRAPHMLGLHIPVGAVEPGSLQAALNERKVSVSLRGTAVRISPHVYNDRADIRALIDALRAAG